MISQDSAGATNDRPHQSSQQRHPRVSLHEVTQVVREDSIRNQQTIFSTFSQRGSWERNHTPVVELITISATSRNLSLHEATQLAREMYRRGESELFRIGQELFCDPEDIVIPGDLRKAATRGDLPVISKEASPEAYSQLGLLYTKVPESLAVKLGLLRAKKRSARESITDCSTPRVVSGVKYIIDCLKPIGNRAPGRPNKVLLVIEKPSKRIEQQYATVFEALGISPDPRHIGSILHTRLANPSARHNRGLFPPQRHVQYFATAYEALRKTFHEESRYEEEQQKLASIKASWERFCESELPRWVSEKKLGEYLSSCSTASEREKLLVMTAEENGAIRARYERLLDSSLDFFKASAHTEKRKIHDRFARMRQRLAESQTGRINPSPIALQEQANLALKQLRIEDIRIKGTFNLNDRNILQEAISAESGILADTHAALLDRANLLQGDLKLFSNKRLAPYEITREANSIRARLHISRDRLRAIHVRPFVSFRERLEVIDGELTEAIQNRDRNGAKEALAAMFLTTRLCTALTVAEDIKLAFLRSDEKLSEALQSALSTLSELRKKPFLFASPVGVERRSTHAKVLDLFRSLETDTQELQRKHLARLQLQVQESDGVPNKDSRAAFREEALELLKRYDFERLARPVKKQ